MAGIGLKKLVLWPSPEPVANGRENAMTLNALLFGEVSVIYRKRHSHKWLSLPLSWESCADIPGAGAIAPCR